MRAKAALRRDLEQIRAKKQAAQQAAAPVQAQPPAPMVIDLDDLKPTGPAVPVAPMMATGGSPFIANRGIPKAEGKPVAPFPDMGMGMSAPSAAPPSTTAVPFARSKPPVVEQNRSSPKQPTPKQTPKPAPKPSPKSNPPSGRLGTKPSPVATHKQAPKPTASAPPSAAAVAPAPPPVAAPPAPMQAPAPAPVAPITTVVPVTAAQAPPAPVPAMSNPQNTFTNATFTVDSSNSDQLMQNMDMPIFDMDNFGAGGPGDPANMGDEGNEGDDTTMGDLDHFFDNLPADSGENIDDSTFTNIDDYMNTDFSNFDDNFV